MVTLIEKAYGKINLTLDVLGIREDGYHALKSVMQTLSVFDDVQIQVGTGKAWQMSCSREDIPCDERNLAWKAAKVFFTEAKIDPEGLSIHIHKRIPMEAGMGGGSADAAAVLRGLNRHYGNSFTLEELADISAQVGSDVPFCVIGGTAMVEGRGEFVRKISAMPDCEIVLCKPEFSVSTPALYRKIDEVAIAVHPDNAAMEEALAAADLKQICKHVYNVFDPVVAAEHPEVSHIRGICDSCGAWASQMTGSGSVVFAIAPDSETAQRICAELRKHYCLVFTAKPL